MLEVSGRPKGAVGQLWAKQPYLSGASYLLCGFLADNPCSGKLHEQQQEGCSVRLQVAEPGPGKDGARVVSGQCMMGGGQGYAPQESALSPLHP